jgi:serine/threonine protein kinase
MLFLGNLLLTKDRNHVKLAGFEVARDYICDEMTCEVGTYRYMAPEVYIYTFFFYDIIINLSTMNRIQVILYSTCLFYC